MKKIFLVLIMLPIFLSGCSEVFMPMCVIIKDQTLLYSPQKTITVVYAEDKRIRDKFTDILVQADIPNFTFSIAKEMTDFEQIVLPVENQWYSLSLLMQKTPASFAKVETTTYLLKSPYSANLTIKVIGGNLNEEINDEATILVNTFDVCKELVVKFEQTTQNT